ncbi:hypothetical protein SRABI80_03522 [Peribacillus frigoritolerans]|nr:hypothetical protein SRABI80_03522 [Peribacillus frigoritolerans]
MAILTGSPFTTLRIVLMIGSKTPASIKMPKKRIANKIMIPVGATSLIPSSAISPILPPNPPISAKALGTAIKAIMAESRPVIIKIINTTIIKYPNKASISITPIF